MLEEEMGVLEGGWAMDYIVMEGDTLKAIAARLGVNLPTILALNPELSDSGQIAAGQCITLPDREGSPADPAGEPGSASTGSVRFDRERFFAGYRSRFGRLSQEQVEGLEELLDGMESDPAVTDIQVMAYMLATVKHETADRFKPITEYGSRSYFNRYDPVLADTEVRRRRAREMGNTREGDGYRFRGRGYVQITWKKNYRKLGEALVVDLASDPDLALRPDVAYAIMSYGMRKGAFTGFKIGDFVTSGHADYYNARQVINGHDKATEIKGYAEAFEQILRDCLL